jgi:hypothetical protein
VEILNKAQGNSRKPRSISTYSTDHRYRGSVIRLLHDKGDLIFEKCSSSSSFPLVPAEKILENSNSEWSLLRDQVKPTPSKTYGKFAPICYAFH